MKRMRASAGIGLALWAVPAFAQETVQITDGGGKDSTVRAIGQGASPWVAVNSAADLVPRSLTTPGNADGSGEVFLLDTRSGALSQVTHYAGAENLTSTALRVLADGSLLLGSTADLTPGAPGHATADRYSATYLYTPAAPKRPLALVQVTPAAASGSPLSLPSPILGGGRLVLFSSSGDPLGGTNVDLSVEVFLYDRGAGSLSQLTSSGGATAVIEAYDHDRRLVLQSDADLTGNGTNVAGNSALFIEDIAKKTFEQITMEPPGVQWEALDALDAKGRFLLCDRFDGNVAGGSYELWTVDLVKRKLTKLAGVPDNRGINYRSRVPGTNLVVVTSDSDWVPQSVTTPGNADHSSEVFTIDLKTRAVVQRTASNSESDCRFLPKTKSRPAVLTSTADLTPGAPGNPDGVQQVYLLPLGAKPVPPVQATAGDRDSSAVGIDDKGDVLAILSKADLVPASLTTPGNANHVQQVFLLPLKGPRVLRQMTVADKDVSFRGFLHDGRSFLVETKSDLTPGKPGNPKGGKEIYRITYR